MYALVWLLLLAAPGASAPPAPGSWQAGDAQQPPEQEPAPAAEQEAQEQPAPLFKAPPRGGRWGSLLVRGPGEKAEVVTGMIAFTVGKSLTLQQPKQQKVTNVIPAKIAGIEVSIEKESEEPEWQWLEMGNDAKIFTGRTYPDRQYLFTITLADGKRLVGHLLGAPIYVTPEKGPARKFVLRSLQRGNPGQKLADLVHVAAVAFHDKAAPAPWKPPTKNPAEPAEAPAATPSQPPPSGKPPKGTDGGVETADSQEKAGAQ